VRSEEEEALTATQRESRNALELAMHELRDRKAWMPLPDYYAELEKIALEIARIYAEAEEPGPETVSDADERNDQGSVRPKGH